MYRLVYVVRPDPTAAPKAGVGGAYVVCWIDTYRDEVAAMACAARLIEESGWEVETVDDVTTVAGADAVRDEDRPYFEQALTDGEVLVFHTWPADGGDE